MARQTPSGIFQMSGSGYRWWFKQAERAAKAINRITLVLCAKSEQGWAVRNLVIAEAPPYQMVNPSISPVNTHDVGPLPEALRLYNSDGLLSSEDLKSEEECSRSALTVR
jgi:hypothetical protein